VADVTRDRAEQSGLAIGSCDAPIALAQSRPDDGPSPGQREWPIRDEALTVPVRVHPTETGRSAMRNGAGSQV
jgi:hypothetical protein